MTGQTIAAAMRPAIAEVSDKNVAVIAAEIADYLDSMPESYRFPREAWGEIAFAYLEGVRFNLDSTTADQRVFASRIIREAGVGL